ncbi:hypothetical protein [Phenylobacterium sp.]|uniref:hypothetical protein n=1 Tax=Phenylobacterium sp. TaxID=1871053 RepID=UPI002FE0CDF9
MTSVGAVQWLSATGFAVGMVGSIWFAAQVRKNANAPRIPMLTLVAFPLRKEMALLEPQAQRDHAWLVRFWLLWLLSALTGMTT